MLSAEGHGNADVGGSQSPARHQSHITGSIARPDLPDWCTLVPYAGPGDTQELERERERERER